MAGLTCKRCGANYPMRRVGSKRYCPDCRAALGPDQHHCPDCKQDKPRDNFAPRVAICHPCFNRRQHARTTGKQPSAVCGRCQARPRNHGRALCGVCLTELQRVNMVWCNIGGHEIPRDAVVVRRTGPAACAACIADLQAARDDALINAGKCAVCALPLHGHPRCTACGILIGAKHGSTVAIDGECAACARWHARNGRRGCRA